MKNLNTCDYQIVAIVQASTGSSRLLRKVLADIGGRPLIAFLLERLRRCDVLDFIVLATTNQPDDDELVDLAESLGLNVVRGSEQDVLARFALAAASTTASTLVRVTGDCPLVDPDLLAQVISEFHLQGVDYLSTCVPKPSAIPQLSGSMSPLGCEIAVSSVPDLCVTVQTCLQCAGPWKSKKTLR